MENENRRPEQDYLAISRFRSAEEQEKLSKNNVTKSMHNLSQHDLKLLNDEIHLNDFVRRLTGPKLRRRSLYNRVLTTNKTYFVKDNSFVRNYHHNYFPLIRNSAEGNNPTVVYKTPTTGILREKYGIIETSMLILNSRRSNGK